MAEQVSEFSQKFIETCHDISRRRPDYSQADCIGHAIALYTLEHGQQKEHAILSALMEIAAPSIFKNTAAP